MTEPTQEAREVADDRANLELYLAGNLGGEDHLPLAEIIDPEEDLLTLGLLRRLLTALDKARADERARVVEWLTSEAENWDAEVSLALRMAARSIERGNHARAATQEIG